MAHAIIIILCLSVVADTQAGDQDTGNVLLGFVQLDGGLFDCLDNLSLKLSGCVFSFGNKEEGLLAFFTHVLLAFK